ncbi:MAG: acyltransferase [Proteobacteria bacterium]|nr:acyltransferase [Pseudomonadota bacterium]NDC24255.1 acyltransferase [Pseudomonadota bacterium]NDD03700.1 acyltransferase [Pseudomonadota bacterium]NDG26256.1 acyltransferase [Pseudomonadota bacterium]
MKTFSSFSEPNLKVNGLDTWRFICALWVMLNHLGFRQLHLDKSDPVEWFIRGILGNLFNGPAAVIVFFLISGFCIHIPYMKGQSLNVWSYGTRRIIRILLPISIIHPLSILTHVPLTLLSETILWSVTCELIYYLLYPFLNRTVKRIGWKSLIGGSFGAAFLILFTRIELLNYPESSLTNWILGLPCWLLGCQLAESTQQNTTCLSRKKIWMWRLGVWGLSSFAVFLRFHAKIGYPFTLTLFSLVAYEWLKEEISYFKNRTPNRLLEHLGAASFSLYLCHFSGAALPKLLGIPPRFHSMALSYFMIGVLTFLFYFTVEKPSHFLARFLSRKLGPQSIPTPLEKQEAA